jgi:hypothetical protein
MAWQQAKRKRFRRAAPSSTDIPGTLPSKEGDAIPESAEGKAGASNVPECGKPPAPYLGFGLFLYFKKLDQKKYPPFPNVAFMAD